MLPILKTNKPTHIKYSNPFTHWALAFMAATVWDMYTTTREINAVESKSDMTKTQYLKVIEETKKKDWVPVINELEEIMDKAETQEKSKFTNYSKNIASKVKTKKFHEFVFQLELPSHKEKINQLASDMMGYMCTRAISHQTTLARNEVLSASLVGVARNQISVYCYEHAIELHNKHFKAPYTAIISINPKADNVFALATEAIGSDKLKSLSSSIYLAIMNSQYNFQQDFAVLLRKFADIMREVPQLRPIACEVLHSWCKVFQDYRLGAGLGHGDDLLKTMQSIHMMLLQNDYSENPNYPHLYSTVKTTHDEALKKFEDAAIFALVVAEKYNTEEEARKDLEDRFTQTMEKFLKKLCLQYEKTNNETLTLNNAVLQKAFSSENERKLSEQEKKFYKVIYEKFGVDLGIDDAKKMLEDEQKILAAIQSMIIDGKGSKN